MADTPSDVQQNTDGATSTKESASNDDLVATIDKMVHDKVEKILAIQGDAVKDDREMTETEEKESSALQKSVESLNARRTVAQTAQERKAKYEQRMEEAKSRAAAAAAMREDPMEPGEYRDIGNGRVVHMPEAHPERGRMRPDNRGLAFNPTPLPRIERDLVYARGGDTNFMLDLAKSVYGDSEARERLDRHAKVHAPVKRMGTISSQRAVDTGNVQGQVVPQYLSDMTARFPTGGRPFMDFLGSRDLPAVGLDIYVPRMAIAPSVDGQDPEGSAFESQDPEDNLLKVQVRTYAGTFPVTVQSVERGVMTEDILWTSLMDQLDEKCDSDVLHGPGNAGKVKGMFSTAPNVPTSPAAVQTDYAGATANDRTFAKLWAGISGNTGKVWEQRKRGPNLHIMAPRRWTYLSGSLDSTNRPVLMPGATAAFNPAALGPAAQENFGIVGSLATGLPVMVNANVGIGQGAGANEDWVATIRTQDQLLWESPVVTMVAEQRQATSGLVDLIARRYICFTSEWQVNSVGILKGTGLSSV